MKLHTLIAVFGMLASVSSQASTAAELKSLDLGSLLPAEQLQRHLDEEDGGETYELSLSHYVRRTACYAENARGLRFEAIGLDSNDTQRRALDRCYRQPSARCHALGCRVVYVRTGD